MTKEEKKAAAFARMSAEQREKAEAKARARAEKKAAEAAKLAQITSASKTQYEPNFEKTIAAKKQLLKELSLYFRAVQLGKADYQPSTLDQMKKCLRVDDVDIFREEYIDIIRASFSFRTPEYTHPVKTEAANFLSKVMTKTQEVEWGLILGLLTEGYISKTLASLLTKQRELIVQSGLDRFVFRFVKEIKLRNGNLEEDGSVSPFTEKQKKRVDELFALYETCKQA